MTELIKKTTHSQHQAQASNVHVQNDRNDRTAHEQASKQPSVEPLRASHEQPQTHHLQVLDRMELIRCLRRQPNASKRIDAVLFDKDGTLLDFIYMWGYWADQLLRSFREALEADGLNWQEENVAGIWGTLHDSDGHIIDYDVHGPLAMGTMNDVYAVLAWQGYRAGWSWGQASQIVRELAKAADQQLEQARPVKEVEGATAFIKQCRQYGLKLGVVTADDTANAYKHVSWLGVEPMFDVMIGSDRVERGKPFPDMVQLACQQLGVEPAHTIVFGDTNGDMMMAQAAGCEIAIGIGQSQAFILQSMTITSFAELLTEEETME